MTDQFTLFASPWPVNLLILVPFLVYDWFQKDGLQITKRQLLISAIFGIAFGFVEAAVVVDIRAAIGLLPGYMGSLADVVQQASSAVQAPQLVGAIPQSLLVVEVWREAATMVMLVTIAMLTVKRFRERAAMFLWVFAFWDLFYYVGLYLTIGWPTSLTSPDVLFLIPVPWYSQVWFPYVITTLTMLAIYLTSKGKEETV